MKLVKISAIWCPSCLIMNDMIENIAKELNLELICYDYDLDEEIVNKYNPGKILPVIILEKDGKEITRIIGEKKKEEIIKEVQSK